MSKYFFFFFQAEDGIRDPLVTGVQTCALPISRQTVLEVGQQLRHQGDTADENRQRETPDLTPRRIVGDQVGDEVGESADAEGYDNLAGHVRPGRPLLKPFPDVRVHLMLPPNSASSKPMVLSAI